MENSIFGNGEEDINKGIEEASKEPFYEWLVLEYIAFTESKFHNAPAPSYQNWLEVQLQSERIAHNETKQLYERLKKGE